MTTEAEENYAYWVQSYATDLAKNRDPDEFGMRWMRIQIREWEEMINAERIDTGDKKDVENG